MHPNSQAPVANKHNAPYPVSRKSLCAYKLFPAPIANAPSPSTTMHPCLLVIMQQRAWPGTLVDDDDWRGRGGVIFTHQLCGADPVRLAVTQQEAEAQHHATVNLSPSSISIQKGQTNVIFWLLFNMLHVFFLIWSPSAHSDWIRDSHGYVPTYVPTDTFRLSPTGKCIGSWGKFSCV